MAPTIAEVSTAATRATVEMSAISVKLTPITRRVLNKWIRGLSDGQVFEHGFVSIPRDGQQVSAGWTSCDHLAAESKPEISYGLACVPGHLMCADCFVRAAEAWGVDTCDWCRTRVADGTHGACPTVCALGPVIVLMILCESHREVDRDR